VDDRTNIMSPRPLSAGSQIDGYKIREVLGMGGLGITYKAHDSHLDREVAIREYLPTSCAVRHVNFSVKPISADHEERYKRGLANYLNVARTLHDFTHNNIIKVHAVIETNATAYMVMESEHGVGLDTIIDQCGTLEQNHQTQIFFPLFDGLQKIHELGFVHRSIKPSNIRIREDGSPVLLDFGSARQTSMLQPIESTALANQDYMPLEQYSAEYGEQGPWTDIYSLAAIMYRGVTGANPDEALSRSDFLMRSQPDTVQPLSAEAHPTYKQSFLSALHSGLTLQPKHRPQSLSLWQLLFDGDLEAYRRQSADASAAQSNPKAKTATLQSSTSIPAHNTNSQESVAPLSPAQPDSTANTNELTQNQADTNYHTGAEPFVAETNQDYDEVDIPLGASPLDDTDDEFLNAGVLSAQPEEKSNRIKSRLVGSAIAASIALVIGIMFLQNKSSQIDPAKNLDGSGLLAGNGQTNTTANEVDSNAATTNALATSAMSDSSTSTDDIETPGAGIASNATTLENAVEASVDDDTTESMGLEPTTNTPINNTTTEVLASNPTSDAPVSSESSAGLASGSTNNITTTGETTVSLAAAMSTTVNELPDSGNANTGQPETVEFPAVYFEKPLPNDPQTENPRTFLEMAELTAPYSPVEGLDEQFWKDKNCSDCHNWTRASLCQQGNYYASEGESEVNRIQHPFGGYYKLALLQWASNDCS